MKFLIVEPSSLPILIPLGTKYSAQDPVFKSLENSKHRSILKVSNKCLKENYYWFKGSRTRVCTLCASVVNNAEPDQVQDPSEFEDKAFVMYI